MGVPSSSSPGTGAAEGAGSGALMGTPYGPIGMLVGGILGSIGGYEAGKVNSDTSKYNAKVASQNALMSAENARIAMASGETQAGIQGQKTRSQIAGITSGEAASGVDIKSGSSPLVKESQQEIGMLDAATIRSNAAREAFGYKTQEVANKSQETLDLHEATADKTASSINSASTFLGGVGQAGNAYSNYQLYNNKNLGAF